MPDEMTVEGQPRKLGLSDPQAKFGDPLADWTGGLLLHSFGNFDGPYRALVCAAGKAIRLRACKKPPEQYAYAGMILNEMFRHLDFMKMAAFTMATSAIDYKSTSAV